MESLKGKVVLITGASSGIGEGIAKHFARLGCRLAITGRSEVNLERVSADCLKAGLSSDDVLAIVGDITKADDRRSIVEKTVGKFGGLNVLINNAGMVHYNKITEITEESYDELFDTNVKSHMFLTRLALPHIIKVKGSIVNTSSICGQRATPEVGAYCMTKAAIDMFTECLALEMAPHGVRVNAINPGSVISNIARRSWGNYQDDADYQKFLDVQKCVHPIGRVGIPEDCAEAVAFLASDASSFITGQLLFVDGGRHCVTTAFPTKLKK